MPPISFFYPGALARMRAKSSHNERRVQAPVTVCEDNGKLWDGKTRGPERTKTDKDRAAMAA